MDWPARFFKPGELLSPDGMAIYARGIMPLRVVAIYKLDCLRSRLDVPLIVNTKDHLHRGFRSPAEQIALVANNVTPNAFSFHCQGVAFDVSSPDMSPEELAAEAKADNWRGIITYKTWVHIDLRDGDTYWGNHAD